MATPAVINDGDSGHTAKVTKFGQLVTSPLDYSTPVSISLDTDDTAFNFITPVQDHSIVITDIVVNADNSVNAVIPAEIEIYSATEPNTITIDQGIVSPRLVRGDNLPLTGLNLLIPEGKFVNAKTNDNNILITIMFYRVPAENV